MRKFSLRIILFFALQFPFQAVVAQEKFDTLFFANGAKEIVVIIKNFQDHIEFCYPGEDMLNVLGKSQLKEVHYRSDRRESFCLQKERKNPLTDVMMGNRMSVLEAKKTEGSKKALKGVHRISLSVIISEELGGLIVDFDSVNINCPYVFSSGAQCDDTFSPGAKDEEYCAILYLVKADANDGEVYGYVEYYKKGVAVPLYSFYINGNGLRRNSPFDDQLLSAVYDAGVRAFNRVYHSRQ